MQQSVAQPAALLSGPEGARARRRMLYLVAGMTMLGPFSQTFYAPSISSVRDDLATTNALVGATVSVYGLVQAVAQIAYGPLVDRHPARKLLVIGLLVFVAANVLAARAATIEQLILLRGIQAAGIAIAQTIGPALVAEVFPASERGWALGVFVSLVTIGPILGPLGGSVVGPTLGWRADFLVIAVAGLVVAALLLRYLVVPRPRSARPSLGAMLGIFVRPVTLGVCFLGFSQFFALFSAVPFVSMLLRERLDTPEQWIGLIILPLTLSLALGAPFGGQLARRYGQQPLMLIGGFGLPSSVAVIAAVAFVGDGPWWTAVVGLAEVLFGLSLSLNMPAQLLHLTESYPTQRGMATAVYNSVRFVGSATGPFLIGAVVDQAGLGPGFLLSVAVLLGAALFAAVVVRNPSASSE